MRVRPRRTAPPFLNPRDQRRMLGLVGALAFTLVAVGWASDPAHWHWIAPPNAGPAEDRGLRFDAALPGDRPAGSFRAVAGGATVAEKSEAVPATLPAALTAAVRERTIGLSRAERASADAVLARLAGADPAALSAVAEDVAFDVLMSEPGFYRGRAVTLSGLARGVRDLPGRDAGGGRVGTADVWFFPPGAGNHPVRALVNGAAGLPRGDRLAEAVPVRVTGYFFKLEGYEAESGLQVAPLLLADAAVPAPPAPGVPATPPALPWVILAVAGLACGAGGLLVWKWRAGDRAYERGTLRRLAAAGRDSPDLLPADAADPAAFLAGLSAADAAPAER